MFTDEERELIAIIKWTIISALIFIAGLVTLLIVERNKVEALQEQVIEKNIATWKVDSAGRVEFVFIEDNPTGLTTQTRLGTIDERS